jgi:hypothetical protein
MVINAMAEDSDYETPDQADLETWAETYGLSIPVVADVGYGAGYNYGLSGGLPHTALIEPGMVINNMSYPTEEQIAEVLGE